MTLENSAQNTQKIGSINALRFMAAMFVLFYHFAFVFYYANIKEIPLYISFSFILILLFGLSYIIHRVFERHGRVFIDHKIDRIVPGFLKRL